MDKKLAKEALERTLLLMKYDTSKTLTENEVKVKQLLKEDELQGMKSLLAKCDAGNVGDVGLTQQQQEEVAGQIFQAFKGAGTDEEMFKTAIETMAKKGNLADLCAISANYKEMSGEDLADGIEGDVGGMLGFGGSLMTKAHTVFRQMFKRTQDSLTIDTKGKDINHFRKMFPCIFQSAAKWCVKSGCGPIDTTQGKYNFIRIKDEDGVEHWLYETGEIMRPDESFTGYYMSCASGVPTPTKSKPAVTESELSKKKHLGEWKIPDGGQQGGSKQGGNKQGGGQQGGGYNKTTATLQQQLYDSGFYIGNSGQLKNGVDGVLGNKTNAARQAYLNGKTCAQYNQENNFPMPPTCKSSSVAPKTEVKPEGEINVIDPSTY